MEITKLENIFLKNQIKEIVIYVSESFNIKHKRMKYRFLAKKQQQTQDLRQKCKRMN